MNFSSKLFQDAVDEFAHLPGIGKRTALRLALFLLKQDKDFVANFVNSLTKMHDGVIYCSICHNISDKEVCEICANPSRDHRSEEHTSELQSH